MFATGEGIVCGTSTTGTGTLTLAACPSAVGGANPVVALGTSGAWPCSPVIIEYTDSTFQTISQMEVGRNCTLTLAAAITSATLTRSPEVTFTGGTYNNSAPSAISIGTAANVLVFFGPSSFDTLGSLLSYNASGITNGDGLGATPVQGSSTSNSVLVVGTSYFQRVWIAVSGLVKSASVRCTAAITTPTSNSVAAALFESDTNGLPSKRVIDFGSVSGTSGAPLGATGNVTFTASSAVYLRAGFYIFGILATKTGGSGNPSLRGATSVAPSMFGTALATTGGPINTCIVSASADLNDPPNTTGIAFSNQLEFALAFRST